MKVSASGRWRVGPPSDTHASVRQRLATDWCRKAANGKLQDVAFGEQEDWPGDGVCLCNAVIALLHSRLLP